MVRLFISYRRAEAPRYSVGRIRKHLADAFGPANVHIDVDSHSIPVGSRYADVIDELLNHCDAILVMIGPNWLTTRSDEGVLRLNEPHDMVRKEIELALSKGMMLIPVLLDAAKMPNKKQLPESIKELASKNAVEIREDPDFDRDIEKLIKGLKQDEPPSTDIRQPPPRGVRLPCPKCQRRVKIPATVMGKRLLCPHCGAPIKVAENGTTLVERLPRPRNPPEGQVNESLPPKARRGCGFRLAVSVLLLAVLIGGGGLVWWKGTPWGWLGPAPPPPDVVRGGGSTFIDPLMQHWAGVYEKRQNVRVDYQAVGSTRGVDGVVSRVYLFGCSDTTLTEAQRAKANGDLLQIPLALGAIVPAYNLPEVKGQLRFTGPILADIYLGKIKSWDDEALQEVNPGEKLPARPITPVHRSDASGTTSLWTDYLGKISAEWKDQVGTGPLVTWPVGLEGKRNDGVADLVSANLGAVGYVELTYALQNHLKFGQVKNRDGQYVTPTQQSVTSAATEAVKSITADLTLQLLDRPERETYPIAGTTYAILYTDQTSNPSGRQLVAFLRWATHDGQAYVKDLKYAPLPPEVVQRIDAALAKVRLAPP